MSQDKSAGGAPVNGWPDGGAIHEWLDGALDAAAAERMEALVAESPEFAAQVAEERGLLAAASRIVTSLDHVPAGVIASSSATAATAAVTPLAAAKREKFGARRRVPWRRIGSIAALLMVGVTGVVIVQRDPAVTEGIGAVSAKSMKEMISPSEFEAITSDTISVAADAAPEPPRQAMAAGSMAETRTAPQTALTSARSAPAPTSSAGARARIRDSLIASGVNAAAGAPARLVPSPAELPSPAARTGERVAADPSLRPRLASVVEQARRAPAAAAPLVADATAKGFAASESRNESELFAEVASDLRADELAFAVQRVECAPSCQQIRTEIASDGRLRRWVQQSLLASSAADTGRVALVDIARVRALVVSLEMASLPAMIRLDGSGCRAVAQLRESLRVEFRVGGELKRVLALPWCSDGTHAIDKLARAVEELAARQLGTPGDSDR